MTTGVQTSTDKYKADVVVLAAALGIPELAQQLQLHVPLTVKPRTVTVITKPLQRFLEHIVVTGNPWHILLVSRQTSNCITCM